MFSIEQTPVPRWALLKTYRAPNNAAAWDAYQDCFRAPIGRPVTLTEWLAAFYTAPVFRVERWILAALVRMPSTDAEARELASGRRDRFAAWRVVARSDTQLLLEDFKGRTRSWLAVLPLDAGQGGTLLYFGSGIRTVRDPRNGESKMTWGFRALSGFHIRYSEILLATGRRRLEHATRGGRAIK